MHTTLPEPGKGRRTSRFAREYDFIATARRHLVGLGGLTILVKQGCWTDAAGRRRRTELVQLGAASDLQGALRLAECGLGRHPPGTRQHRRYADWAWRLRQTMVVVAATDARYRALVAERTVGLPYHTIAAE